MFKSFSLTKNDIFFLKHSQEYVSLQLTTTVFVQVYTCVLQFSVLLSGSRSAFFFTYVLLNVVLTFYLTLNYTFFLYDCIQSGLAVSFFFALKLKMFRFKKCKNDSEM